MPRAQRLCKGAGMRCVNTAPAYGAMLVARRGMDMRLT